MPHRIALAVEGPSDRAVLETLCRKAGHHAKAGQAEGKNHLFQRFVKILRVLEVTFRPTHFLVVADLHPETACPPEADKWRNAIRQRFPKAQLCLSVWELEAWLLADPKAVVQVLRVRNFHHPNPDAIGGQKPSELLENLYRNTLGYGRGLAYDKQADGTALAELLDVETAARNSPSFAHFMKAMRSRQERLA